jgi:hypothetical protein
MVSEFRRGGWNAMNVVLHIVGPFLTWVQASLAFFEQIDHSQVAFDGLGHHRIATSLWRNPWFLIQLCRLPYQSVATSLRCQSSHHGSFLLERKPEPLWIWNVRGIRGKMQSTHPSLSSLSGPHYGDKKSDTIRDSPSCFCSGVGFELGACHAFLR